MNTKKLLSLVLSLMLVCSLAACGVKGDNKTANMNRNDASMTDEPKNAEEALALHKKLLEQENVLLSENTGLWEKVLPDSRWLPRPAPSPCPLPHRGRIG